MPVIVPSQLLPVRQALFGALELLVGGTLLLFDEVIFNATRLFRRVEDLCPRRHAFAKQRPVAGRRRPVLAVNALDSSWIRVDPRDRIFTDLDAGTDIELQDDV